MHFETWRGRQHIRQQLHQIDTQDQYRQSVQDDRQTVQDVIVYNNFHNTIIAPGQSYKQTYKLTNLQKVSPQTPIPALGFKTLEQIFCPPHTPKPELGLQPSDKQTDSATTEIRGPPHPLSRTRVTTLGQNVQQEPLINVGFTRERWGAPAVYMKLRMANFPI